METRVKTFLLPSIHPIHFPINIEHAECLLGAEHCSKLHSKVGGPVSELEEPRLLREIRNLHTDDHL